jgi:ribosomal protein S10
MYSYQLKISTNNVEDFSFIEKRFPTKVKIVVLPRKRKKFVFIRSPHVNKKSKEHFQILKHKRLYFVTISSDALKIFLLKAPNDVNIVIKKITL